MKESRTPWKTPGNLRLTGRFALLLAGAALIALTAMLAACGGSGSGSQAEGGKDGAPEKGAEGIVVPNAFKYTHVDGHKKETEKTAFVLFEYEQLKTVKYQVAYIACTCRGPEVNYWSVAYVEINKENNSLDFLSYGKDREAHYTAGLYGDSTESWDGTKVRELFGQFMEEELLGKTEAEIDAIEPMHGKVDTYTGATVTPNNAARMLQGLFDYHNAKY